MRTGFPGGPRLEWYDRNAIFKEIYYDGAGIGPHSITQRASYTVPAGKNALVTNALVVAVRATASTGVGAVMAFIRVGTYYNVLIEFFSVAQNSGQHLVSGQSTLLLAGAGIYINTYDDSTGGAVDYRISAQMDEFDT